MASLYNNWKTLISSLEIVSQLKIETWKNEIPSATLYVSICRARVRARAVFLQYLTAIFWKLNMPEMVEKSQY